MVLFFVIIYDLFFNKRLSSYTFELCPADNESIMDQKWWYLTAYGVLFLYHPHTNVYAMNHRCAHNLTFVFCILFICLLCAGLLLLCKHNLSSNTSVLPQEWKALHGLLLFCWGKNLVLLPSPLYLLLTFTERNVFTVYLSIWSGTVGMGINCLEM